jgi:hypothetical protein
MRTVCLGIAELSCFKADFKTMAALPTQLFSGLTMKHGLLVCSRDTKTNQVQKKESLSL